MIRYLIQATSGHFEVELNRRAVAHVMQHYEWQEEIIQEEIGDEKAIEELEQRLLGYNEASRKAFGDVVAKYAFTVIPIGLAMAGAVMAGPGLGLVIGAAWGLVEGHKKDQLEGVEHGPKVGRGKEGGQDGRTTTPSRAQLGPLFSAPTDFGPLHPIPRLALTPGIQSGSRMHKHARTDLCGGCQVTGIPTVTGESSEDCWTA